jgi:choline dehydrogenase-like flavoprotein
MLDDFNPSLDPDDTNQVFGGGVSELGGQYHPISEAKYLPLIGENHKKWMKSSPFRDHMSALNIIGEDPPMLTNRVDLDENVRDVYGFPVARVTYKSHPNDEKAAQYYRPKMERILWEAGAALVLWADALPIPGPDVPDTKHLLGTLRMGADPDRSVTDRYGKFHDLTNLYCADGGLFVTSTSYNPTLTQQALAAMQAHHILEA